MWVQVMDKLYSFMSFKKVHIYNNTNDNVFYIVIKEYWGRSSNFERRGLKEFQWPCCSVFIFYDMWCSHQMIFSSNSKKFQVVSGVPHSSWNFALNQMSENFLFSMSYMLLQCHKYRRFDYNILSLVTAIRCPSTNCSN